MLNLTDRVIIITGASSGIGKAAALKFAEHKCRIVLAARRQERLEQLREEVEKAGCQCLAVKTDLTSEEDVISLFDRTIEQFGRIDVLLNNAGRGLKSEIKNIDAADWQNLMEVNVTGVFLCTREAVKRMIDAMTPGHIITVSSLAGRFAVPNYAAYCASKHAVTGFMKAAWWELRKYGIKCTAIHPSRIDTEFFDDYKQKPSKKQMLPADYFADFIVACAQQSFLRKTAVLWRNIGKRILNLIS